MKQSRLSKYRAKDIPHFPCWPVSNADSRVSKRFLTLFENVVRNASANYAFFVVVENMEPLLASLIECLQKTGEMRLEGVVNIHNQRWV
jgi:hypothetical protein